jgi:hypothetical protein
VSASETACIGAVNVPVTLEGRVGVLEVLVVPEVRHEMILGIDFWTEMGIVPNLLELTWEFADPSIDAGNRPQVGNIITKDDLSANRRSRLEKCVERYFDGTKDPLLGCTALISHRITLLEDAKPLRSDRCRIVKGAERASS